jgi:hypothetical protein
MVKRTPATLYAVGGDSRGVVMYEWPVMETERQIRTDVDRLPWPTMHGESNGLSYTTQTNKPGGKLPYPWAHTKRQAVDLYAIRNEDLAKGCMERATMLRDNVKSAICLLDDAP